MPRFPPVKIEAYSLISSPVGDKSYSGIDTEGTVGENVVVGDALYLKADGKWWKADASAAVTMPTEAIALDDKSADELCKLLLYGFLRDNSWSYTVGGLLYVSITAGSPTQTRPSGAGEQVQVIGFAYAATIIFFNPSYELVEVS